MSISRTLRLWLFGVTLSTAAGIASASTITTFNVGFENPPYTLAALNGQDGWAGPGTITSARAHSGSQSLRSGAAANSIRIADPTSPTGDFNINSAGDWWLQAWVYVDSGTSGDPALLALSNTLGAGPLISISGSGSAVFNALAPLQSSTRALGASVLDQWIFLSMVHTGGTQGLVMSITGASVNSVFNATAYSGPGSGNPTKVAVGGQANWDDISAGYGSAPGVVPVPPAAWLFGSALGLMGAMRRKTTS